MQTRRSPRSSQASVDSFLQSVLEERKKQLADKRQSGNKDSLEKGDFLDVLLTRSVDDDDVEITEDRIKALVADCIVGGVDSSAKSFEWTLAEILRHPKVLKQLQDEIDETVGRERLVEEEDISKFVYLQAVVKEAFRLHPVSPLLIPRIASEACEIGGYYIPAGTQAFVNVSAIWRDGNVWDKPRPRLQFPDRFCKENDYAGGVFCHPCLSQSDYMEKRALTFAGQILNLESYCHSLLV